MKLIFMLVLFAMIQCKSKVPEEYRGTPDPKWTQIAGPGHGSFQEEWKEGTFPLGVKAVVAVDSLLWMTGQKFSWFSPDGIQWNRNNKADWGERISMEVVYFKNKLWMFGGMKIPVSFQNDIWNTDDGKTKGFP